MLKKIIAYKNLNKFLEKIKTKTIVLAGGCFDVLHLGHLKFLEAAKKQAEILIIALESDENIKRSKGNNRPVNNQIIRAKNLANFDFVDFIILLPEMKSDDDYKNLVLKMKPKVIAITENDPRLEKKKSQAKLVGTKVVEVIPYLQGYSTTKIINTNLN